MVEWRLGNYELRRRLGEGGMAQVYLARDVRLGREVAVKVLDRTLAERPGFRERFMREARVAAALDHPNIVPLFDFGDTEALYLVMPYVSGGSLQDLLPRAPLPIGEVVTYGSQIADALEYAHQRKVVHRDVKPANMLIHADGRLMLSDFGLAKIVNATTKLQQPRNRPDAGTPEYMAPEQVVGNSDSRSDIYGLGVVLYLLLTGRLPFSGSTSHEVMQAHLYKEPKPVRRYNPSVPAAMEAVVMRAMAKQPNDRFQRAGELGAALLSALIADSGDAPTFVLGSPSHTSAAGESRPTGQIPIAMPAPVMPEQQSAPPPWRHKTLSGAMSGANSAATSEQPSSVSAAPPTPGVSAWGAERSGSSLTGILPDLNKPFTSLDSQAGMASDVNPFSGPAAGRANTQSGQRGAFSGPGASLGAASGHSGIGGFTDSQTTGVTPGVMNTRTVGRMPAVPPTYPASYPPASHRVTPPPFEPATPSMQPMQPMQPMQSMQPMQPMQPGRPMEGVGKMSDVAQTYMPSQPAAPAQRSALRAALPGLRMSEPPARSQRRERNTRLWIVVGALLIVGLVAVFILLRWLEAGAAGFMLFAPR